jgi:DNA (cytosine-5)-methyltransferase 1
MYNVLDLFSGIGGFMLGLQKAGLPIGWHGYSEINKHSSAIYQYHFKNGVALGNIRKIKESQLPNIDILCAGFPCQPFSIAGNRQGFNDTRGTLFYEIARIAEMRKPKVLFLENVKGLLNHDDRSTITTIFKVLSELGYAVGWQMVNTSWFLPQNRERLFIMGVYGAKTTYPILPIKENEKLFAEQDKPNGRWTQAENITTTVTTRAGSRATSTFIAESKLKVVFGTGKNPQGMRVYDPEGISCTLAAEGGGLGAKTGYYYINETDDIRRLTPLECERLQGLPDNWTAYGHYDNTVSMFSNIEGIRISDEVRYKCLGNAVTVNVITEIAKNIKQYFLETINALD